MVKHGARRSIAGGIKKRRVSRTEKLLMQLISTGMRGGNNQSANDNDDSLSDHLKSEQAEHVLTIKKEEPSVEDTERRTGYPMHDRLSILLQVAADQIVQDVPMFSDVAYISRIPFKIGIMYVEKEGGVRKLALVVYCNEKSVTNMWKVDAKIEAHLNDADTLIAPPQAFDVNASRIRLLLPVTRAELDGRDPRFVDADGVLNVDVVITVLSAVGIARPFDYDLTRPCPGLSDAVLVVQDGRLYISRSLLAIRSAYFYRKFFGAEKINSSEMVVQGATMKEMLQLLEAVYNETAEIDDDNVESVLKLAHRFEMPGIINKCIETFDPVITKEYLEVPRILKALRLSDQYKLSDLQDICIEAIFECGAFEVVKNSEEYRTLSNDTKVILLEKHLCDVDTPSLNLD